MSHKGYPYDNTLSESIVATLKTECFGHSIPALKAPPTLMIFDYIETFCNRAARIARSVTAHHLISKNKCSPRKKN